MICVKFSYTKDSTLHYFTSFNKRQIQEELYSSRLDATERLSSKFEIIYGWGKTNSVLLTVSKTQF